LAAPGEAARDKILGGRQAAQLPDEARRNPGDNQFRAAAGNLVEVGGSGGTETPASLKSNIHTF
jgi:hypothetical protein